MKKIICLLLILTMMLTACSKWKAEIVDPTKPVEEESAVSVSKAENEKAEEEIPQLSDFIIMKICEGEETSEKDFVFLSEYEKDVFGIYIQQDSWVEVPEDWEGKGGLLSPANYFETGDGDIMLVSPEGENTLITIKYGYFNGSQKCYYAPKEVAFNIEEFRKELAEKVLLEETEPEIEDFCKILIYSDDNNSIHYEFSNKEYSEWISAAKPENWREDTSEKEGGSVLNPVVLSTAMNGTMYIGYDFYGDEIALIKYGRDRSLSKSYVMPEGTLSVIKDFEKKIIRENPNIFTYPECNYEMSADAFEKRENDGYILYLDELLMHCDWTAAKDDPKKPYTGFEDSMELNNKILFNVFMFAFDYCGNTAEQDLSKIAWYDSSDEKYHIPMDDIYTVLNKYLVNYWVDMEETGVNYEFDEEKREISIAGGYGITSTRYDDRKVVSVTDNGDGTVTAVVESHVYYMDENDNMILSEKPERRNTMVLQPDLFRCVVLSHKIESIND